MSTAPAHALTERLKKLTRGLSFQSESDYPVKPFFAEGNGRKSLKASDLSERPARQVDFDSLFANATAVEDWHGPEEKESALRYRELVGALKSELADLKVYKVGKVCSATPAPFFLSLIEAVSPSRAGVPARRGQGPSSSRSRPESRPLGL